MKIDWSFLEPFQVESNEDVQQVLKELDREMKRLVKRIRKAIVDGGFALQASLRAQVKKIGSLLKEAFTLSSMEDYTQGAQIFGKELAGALYLLQGKLSQFRVALIRAAEPIARLLVPIANAAVDALTGLANSVGQVLRYLFFGTEQTEEFADSIVHVSAAGKSMRRTLASFDQLNRLGEKTGGSFSSITPAPLTGYWKQLADSLTELVKPLREIDLTPAAESLKKLVQALEPIKKELFRGLKWAWDNVFVPLAQWTAEKLLPVFLDTLTSAVEALGRLIEELKPVFIWFWENFLKPLGQWAGDRIIAYLQEMSAQLQGLGGWLTDSKDPVDALVNSGNLLLETVGKLIAKLMTMGTASDSAQKSFGNLIQDMLLSNSPLSGVLTALSTVKEATDLLTQGFQNVDKASGDTYNNMSALWGKIADDMKAQFTDPTYAGLKDNANRIIELLNGVMKGTANGANFMADALNAMSFSLPDWIPGLGGKRFQIKLKKVTAPYVPYLAQGAVLPANKPFMAVVGDQKHGTNIEAPLATIEEAVTSVLDHRMNGVMAGFAAVTQRQERILEAVLGIDLSDGAIAAAADRYQEKMAIVMGGY